MRYLILRNEKRVSDITDKIYQGLKAKAREQAETALLKANPELRSLKNFRKGFIVRIPPSTAQDGKGHRQIVDPIEDFTQEMVAELKLLEQKINDKFDHFDQKQNDTLEKIKAAAKELKEQDSGDKMANLLKKNIPILKKENNEKRKHGLDAIKKLQDIAASIDR